MKLIDGNARLRSDSGSAAAYSFLRLMDELEIEKAIVAGGGYISPDQLARHAAVGGVLTVDVDNALLREQCNVAPDRLLPVYIANPHREAELYRDCGGAYYALKLAPVLHGVPLRDPRMLALIETASRFNHPVYLHCLHQPGFEVPELVEIARQFPQTRFVLEHAGVGICDFYAVSLIREQQNIYFETSGGFTSVIKAACERLGTERVIFGSEYPLEHPVPEIQKIRCLDLDDRDQERVFGKNALALINVGESNV